MEDNRGRRAKEAHSGRVNISMREVFSRVFPEANEAEIDRAVELLDIVRALHERPDAGRLH